MDKTELNFFAQNLYDQKRREGKHGHYESMFYVIHKCIEKVAPPKKEWVGLSDDEVSDILDREIGFNSCWGPETDFARAIEQALKEKNGG